MALTQNFMIGDAKVAHRHTLIPNFKGILGSNKEERKLSDYIRVNVSGRDFLLRYDNVSQFPDTLLGSSDREQYWREELQAYYFDRNREFFISVQQFYQYKGVFHMPHSVPDQHVIETELDFYRIRTVDDEDGFNLEEVNTATPSNKQKMYMLLNFPKSSTSANVMAWADCLLIALSVIMLIIESEPLYKKYFADNEERAHKYAFAANCLIMGYFTLDYVLRAMSHPVLLKFFKLYLPWLDLLSILPFYVEIIMQWASSDDETVVAGPAEEEHHSHEDQAYTMLRICRIFRVTRVFKLVRRCESLLVLVRALSKTRNELVLLAGMVSISAVFIGSIMYSVEVGHNAQFDSILASCWWAIITITTVGYGDMVPVTFLGKICGSFAVFLALVLIALPATIIVTKFSEEYEKGVNKQGST